jgi:hypothetical protein
MLRIRVIDASWYIAAGSAVVRLVLVRDFHGHEKDDVFVSTDPTLAAAAHHRCRSPNAGRRRSPIYHAAFVTGHLSAPLLMIAAKSGSTKLREPVLSSLAPFAHRCHREAGS